MPTKLQIDSKARRAYRGLLNQYGAHLNQRYNASKLSEEKFWRLQDKLTAWYNNYRPMVEVADFSGM